ncbi:MAG TPA: FAD-dependent oxidoreductase, partial [Urbifossiella sp.]
PAGRALIADGVVAEHTEDDAELDRRTRLQLAEWFGAAVASWQLLRIHRELAELPDQMAGAFDSWQPVGVRPGLYACGDSTMIDGAMSSGFRAAQAAMEDLHSKNT